MIEMRAAFYECDVTPPLGGYMPGYGRNKLQMMFLKDFIQKHW